MYHADRAFVVFILQIGVEQPQLFNKEHPLIDNGPAGQAAHIGFGAGLFKHPAGHIQAAVEFDAGGYARRFAHKPLPDAWHAAAGRVAQNIRAGGNFTPAQEGQALLLADDFKQLFGLVAAQFFLREEKHADSVAAFFTQGDPGGSGRFGKEFVPDLHQDANAVAGFALGIFAGAVLQMFNNLEGVIDGAVRFAALDIHHRANAAVVMLKTRVVQTGPFCRKVLHKLLLPGCQVCALGGGRPSKMQKRRPRHGGIRPPCGNAFVLANQHTTDGQLWQGESKIIFRIGH